MVPRRSTIWAAEYDHAAVAEKGTRPRAVKQQQFEYAYLFGAVCPATGDTEALIAPCMNMDVMEKHLALISKKSLRGAPCSYRCRWCRLASISFNG